MSNLFKAMFIIPGPPVSKKAPVVSTRNNKVCVYSNKQSANYENLVSIIAMQHIPEQPLQGPIAVKIHAIFPRTEYLSKRSKRTNKLLHAPENEFPHIVKPDADNIAKAILDGIKKVGFFKDDSQISLLVISKSYASFRNGIEDNPRVEVTICELDKYESILAV